MPLSQELSLVKAAAGGDQEAYRSLVESYQDRIYGLVVSMVGRGAQADDLTQEIFVKAWFALPKFQRDSSFFTWLYRIASNHCLDYHRRKRLPEQSLDGAFHEDADLTLADSMVAPRQEDPDAEIKQSSDLTALLRGLEPEQRLILVLREIEGHSYEDLSSLLECPVNTVKSRLNRAREALKTLYHETYGNIPTKESVKSDEIIAP